MVLNGIAAVTGKIPAEGELVKIGIAIPVSTVVDGIVEIIEDDKMNG